MKTVTYFLFNALKLLLIFITASVLSANGKVPLTRTNVIPEKSGATLDSIVEQRADLLLNESLSRGRKDLAQEMKHSNDQLGKDIVRTGPIKIGTKELQKELKNKSAKQVFELLNKELKDYLRSSKEFPLKMNGWQFGPFWSTEILFGLVQNFQALTEKLISMERPDLVPNWAANKDNVTGEARIFLTTTGYFFREVCLSVMTITTKPLQNTMNPKDAIKKLIQKAEVRFCPDDAEVTYFYSFTVDDKGKTLESTRLEAF